MLTRADVFAYSIVSRYDFVQGWWLTEPQYGYNMLPLKRSKRRTSKELGMFTRQQSNLSLIDNSLLPKYVPLLSVFKQTADTCLALAGIRLFRDTATRCHGGPKGPWCWYRNVSQTQAVLWLHRAGDEVERI